MNSHYMNEGDSTLNERW